MSLPIPKTAEQRLEKLDAISPADLPMAVAAILKPLLDLEVQQFYEIDGFFLLVNKEVKARTSIQIGQRLSLQSMFDIYFLTINGDNRSGFAFKSKFETLNNGNYLLTFLKGKGPATEGETLIKNDQLVLYNYPNRGSLAIAPQVNSVLSIVFEEQ